MRKNGCKQVNVNLFYRNEIIQIGARHRLLKRTVCYEQFQKTIVRGQTTPDKNHFIRLGRIEKNGLQICSDQMRLA